MLKNPENNSSNNLNSNPPINPVTYFNILEIPLIIAKRLLLVIGLTGLIAVYNVFYTGSLPEYYMSYTEIEFRSGLKATSQGNIGNYSNVFMDSLVGAPLTKNVDEAEIYAHIAQTPRIIDKIIEKNNLKKVYSLSKMRDLRNRINIRSRINVNELGLVEIRYQDTDPKLAFNIVKTYIEELENYYAWRSNEINKFTINEIASIQTQILDEINVAKDQLKTFQEKYGIFNVPQYAEGLIKQIADLKMQLIQAQLDYKIKYAESRNLGNVTSRELQVYQEKINIIQSELDDMNNNSKESFVAYNDLPKINQEYLEIDINIQSLYAIYQDIKKLYNITKLNINKDVETMVIVTEPEVPEDKFFPYRSRIILKNTVFGFIFSIFLCFIIEFYQRLYRKKENKAILLEIIYHIFFWKKINPKKIKNLIDDRIRYLKKVILKR